MPITENPVPTIENIELVHSGEDYFSRLESMITKAQFEIHLQMYIFENDVTGGRIVKALKEAASRKVSIYILLDGFGSLSFPTEIINELKQTGINFRYFSPLFSKNSFYLGRRLHQKVVVVDAKTALIGGINIADKYHGTETEAPWLDYAILVNSKIAAPLAALCEAIYFKNKEIQRKKINPVYQSKRDAMVRILQNDWLNRKNEISDAYIKSISSANHQITIVGGYFLPGRKLANALKKASKNKVRIRLILSGVSDLPMTRRAACYFYSKLLHYNIELYEWNQSVLHGKAAVVDNLWTTIGSFNLNNLSSYGSVEMNVGINSAGFSKMYQEHLNQIISQCQKVTPESLRIRNTLFSKTINGLSYYMTRAIEIMMTYLPYKRFNN